MQHQRQYVEMSKCKSYAKYETHLRSIAADIGEERLLDFR